MSEIKTSQNLNFDDFDDFHEFYTLRLASQLEFGELMCSAIEPALFAMKFKNLPTQQNQQRGATGVSNLEQEAILLLCKFGMK